jgi:hypothetical protein
MNPTSTPKRKVFRLTFECGAALMEPVKKEKEKELALKKFDAEGQSLASGRSKLQEFEPDIIGLKKHITSPQAPKQCPTNTILYPHYKSP